MLKKIRYDWSPYLNVYSWWNLCRADVRFSKHIGSMLTYSAVDCGFEPWSGHQKLYNWYLILLCKAHTDSVLRSKRKDWWARNLDNMSERSDMSTRRLLYHSLTLRFYIWEFLLLMKLNIMYKFKVTRFYCILQYINIINSNFCLFNPFSD